MPFRRTLRKNTFSLSYDWGFLGSFLSKSLKTNQLEVNTDERTCRPFARLKEPRDLFALPKEKDHDCPQQAARWPTECQVLDERVYHIESVPDSPEPYHESTGTEPRPRPVGEENGIVVFNYNPVSAVNYQPCEKGDDSDDCDSDSSLSDTHSPTPEPRGKAVERFIRLFARHRSPSNSNDEDAADDSVYVNDFDDENEDVNNYTKPQKCLAKIIVQTAQHAKAHTLLELHSRSPSNPPHSISPPQQPLVKTSEESPPSQSLAMNAQCPVVVDQVAVEESKVCNSVVLPPIQTNRIDNTCDSCDTNNDLSSPSPAKDTSDTSAKKNMTQDANPIFTQFSRSSVGGSKFLMNVHPYNNNQEDSLNDLEFESRFESGNLAKAVKITPTYYELYLRSDLYTNRHKQWFYFRVKNTRKNVTYRFSIVNLVKPDSLYNEGMRPLMYSTKSATATKTGWRRCGENIAYYRNDDESSGDEEEDNGSYTLTFNIQFAYDNDMVYFAHSYPYTYSDLQDYLMDIQRHPVKSKFCKLRLLCRSLAGNNIYYLTVTSPTADDESNKKKRAVVVTARVHPGETPASWMMKGLMDFITGESNVAKRLRHKFIFKLIPMLNPDGVIVGNTRCSLTGKDLNRQYRTVIRETYPSIWYTKAMLRRLIEDCGVAMYCDMHAHTRKHNVFIYGCENRKSQDKKLSEQVYPLMLHKNIADKFSFESCKFKIQRSKEGTGRIVMWMLGITNSYTMEASFGGSSLGSRNGTHFSTADFESIGRAYCETLLDYCDESPVKVKKRERLLRIIKRLRKRERRERKALRLKKIAEEEGGLFSDALIEKTERLRSKIVERLIKEGSSADEPLNIQLSDYSSDEGDTSSSSSDNEGKLGKYSDLEGPCCQPLKVPPCSPVLTVLPRRDEKKRKRKRYWKRESTKHKTIKVKSILKKNKIASLNPRAAKSASKLRSDKLTRCKSRNSMQIKTLKKKSSIKKKCLVKGEGSRKFGKIRKKLTAKTICKKVSSSNKNRCATNKSTFDINSRSLSTSSKATFHKIKRWRPQEARREGIHEINSDIRILLKQKKVKKKTKSKSSNNHKRNKKTHRTVLELPTTDPGSDLPFSTDDEIYVETEGYGTIPRAHRTHLQNELQRRLQGEVQQTDQQMPPELIVTPAKHKSIESLALRLDEKQKKSSPTALLEFPPIAGNARRTNSWHSLNKCGQKLRIHNTNYIETTENLQFKLSLKKQIWTGITTDATFIDRNLPLSWGVPPIVKKKSLQTMRDDSEALLTACSQKLAAWQQSELNKNCGEGENPEGSMRAKNKVSINLVVPDMIEKQQSSRKSASNSIKTPTKIEPCSLNEPPKHKKKRNPLSRIAETTQILSRLAKSKVKANASQRKSLSNSIIATTTTGVSIIPPLIPISKPHHNKFKTGGLVATAVQPMKKKKLRLLGQAAKLQDNPVGELDAEKPTKKIKTKVKKKKTKVAS